MCRALLAETAFVVSMMIVVLCAYLIDRVPAPAAVLLASIGFLAAIIWVINLGASIFVRIFGWDEPR